MAKLILQTGSLASALLLALSGCATNDVDLGQVSSAIELEELHAPNEHGVAASYSTLGPIDRNNMFFRTDFGTNGRSCESCHSPDAGWTFSAKQAKQLFKDSDGLDPLFRIHDAGTRPDAPLDTLGQRRKAFKPVITEATIRFPTAVADTAEFEVIDVKDPYKYGTTSAFTRFRRPTPTVNEARVATVTWTGGPHDVPAQLEALVNGANAFHAQGIEVPIPLRQEAAQFQLSLYHAQVEDKVAGRLDADGANGGPVYLSTLPFEVGENSGGDFDPKVFDIYDAWLDADAYKKPSKRDRHRASIARGQEVFNFKALNDNGLTCSRCHNVLNTGSGSRAAWFNIGTDDVHGAPKVPIVTVRNKTTGEIRKTTDLGRAIVTGAWNDIGAMKVPQLRGLASRAPYFHDGRAKNIKEVVKHYEKHFGIRWKKKEKEDLINFLQAL